MFTIDMLKGKALPIKIKPFGIVMAVVTSAIPVLITVVIIGLHIHSRVVTSIKENEVVALEAKIEKLSDAVTLQKALESQKMYFTSCISEIKSSIKRFTQWSPILTALVKDMPNSVVLTDLEIRRKSIRKKVPDKTDPAKLVDKDIPITTVRLIVSDVEQSNNDKAIQDFKDSICSSSVIGPKLEKITVSRESEMGRERSVVKYMIDCVFKVQI
jgi:hypothetical protein